MMGTKTSIAWTDSSWNPTRGCSRVSLGCGGPHGQGGCYAERIAARFSGPGKPYEGLATMTSSGPRWTGKIAFIESALDLPLRWKKPRRIFVDSMSDLFHEKVPDEWIDRIFAVMALAPQHIFQILTKRPERMLAYCAGLGRSFARLKSACPEGWAMEYEGIPLVPWPLPNVWLGGSVENQATADERIPFLLQTPAAVRWVSYEPALGPVVFTRWLHNDVAPREPALDWIVVGGESGPGARPFDLDWARQTVTQCHGAWTTCFVKQLGARPFDLAGDGMAPLSVGLTARWEPPVGAYLDLQDHKGGDPDEWPDELRVREWPMGRLPAH